MYKRLWKLTKTIQEAKKNLLMRIGVLIPKSNQLLSSHRCLVFLNSHVYDAFDSFLLFMEFCWYYLIIKIPSMVWCVHIPSICITVSATKLPISLAFGHQTWITVPKSDSGFTFIFYYICCNFVVGTTMIWINYFQFRKTWIYNSMEIWNSI